MISQWLNPQVRKKDAAAWVLYDFANSSYTTIILTAVYNAYFVGVLAKGKDWGTLAWTSAVSLSYALVMLAGPFIGAHADRGHRQRWLRLATVGCVATTAGLAFIGTGNQALMLALLLIVLSNFTYGIGENTSNSYLPYLAKPAFMGRLSSLGFSIGYLGGIASLALTLGYITSQQAKGVTASSFVPTSVLIAATLYFVAALPAMLTLPSPMSTHNDAGNAAHTGKAAIAQLRATLREARGMPNLQRLYWAATFYQSGVSVVITIAAIFATEVMQFSAQDSIMLILLVNITAAVGALLFGFIQDRIGAKRALLLTLAGWMLMTVLMLTVESRAGFWLAANIVGICLGSSQSIGRAMAGQLAPQDRAAEFYGAWGFYTRLSGILGPLVYGCIHYFSGANHRAAIAATGLFFVAGMFWVARIDWRANDARQSMPSS
jgi:MFS transporter, UMF1 family